MLYLVVGDKSREFEYSNLVKKIKEKNSGITEEYFDLSQKEEEKFLQSVSSNSIFGGKKFIILKRAELVKRSDSFFKILKKYSYDNNEVIVDYFDEKKKFSKTALKIAKEIGKVIESYEYKKGEKAISYIKDNLSIDSREAHELMQMIGDNYNTIKNEVEKIKLFLNGEEFEIDKIKNIVSLREEYTIFESIDKLINGKKRVLLDYLNMNPNSYIMFFEMIVRELKLILKLKILENERKIDVRGGYPSFRDKAYLNIKGYFGKMHPYVIFNRLKILKIINEKNLKIELEKLLTIDYKIKSGQSPADIEIKNFIIEFNIGK
ncbi:DNA polymerase III subunit delta [Haliovirga abyssi]|uniref:DNA polymerase III delta subunit-like C-terminal domain-containing protein n=1 Tax=Haliovirga abyssi TaxID=2996794 RepID=A0AAU9DAX7_9FUSO|nr:hypothetical protein [Haliovirga abyssi]BDU50470.1 hypothetical protein HLVA_10390 [Haliovirga abyssi]